MSQTTVREIGRRSVPAWMWFLAWAVVGVGGVLAVLGALTIGVFVLPIAVGLAVLLATRPGATIGIPGLISGASLPMFYVAYLNRDGPGNICQSFADGGSACTEEWSPLPWAFIGMVLILGGIAVFVRRRRAVRHLADESAVSAVRER